MPFTGAFSDLIIEVANEAALPAAGVEGRLAYAIAEKTRWRDNGATWDEEPPDVSGGLGYTAEDQANKENTTLDTSTTKYPTNRLVKEYVDGIAANLGKRARVRAATTANITIATALNNGDTLDGVTLATDDLVLVKNQSAAEENGVYVVGVTPARAAEFDTYNEHPGSLIAVQEGTTNADTLWLCTSNVGGTLNSTAIDFSATGNTNVDDTAYDATTWNGDTTHAPSKNAVRDKIESLGASSAWTQVVNENGSSFASWTSGGGTWSSDGTQIKQTDTGASWRTAKFNTVQPLAPGYIWEAQVKAVSTGAGALHTIGLVIGYDGTPTLANCAGLAVDLRLESATRRAVFQRFNRASLLVINPHSWNDDTYYTLRLVASGGYLTAYMDGTIIATAGGNPANTADGLDARYVGLISYGCEAHFKDIKGWSLTLP